MELKYYSVMELKCYRVEIVWDENVTELKHISLRYWIEYIIIAI